MRENYHKKAGAKNSWGEGAAGMFIRWTSLMVEPATFNERCNIRKKEIYSFRTPQKVSTMEAIRV